MAIGDIKKIVADFMGTTVQLINSRNKKKNVANRWAALHSLRLL